MKSPTFLLPPCPACSSIHALVRPVWHYDKMTSKKRGRDTYSLTGCRHAEACDRSKFHDDPEEWKIVEAAWADACGNLCDVKTRDWPEDRRREFERKLEERMELPNVTLPLPLQGEREPVPLSRAIRDPSGTSQDDPPF